MITGIEVCKIKIPKHEDMMNFFHLIIDFESDIFLCSGHRTIDAKSVLGLVSLDRTKEFSLTIVEKVNGEYEKIKKLIKDYGYAVE